MAAVMAPTVRRNRSTGLGRRISPVENWLFSRDSTFATDVRHRGALMATQRLGIAQLMFVHAGPVIVVDTLLTVAGAGPEAMPATFVLSLDLSVMARNRRRRVLSYWAAIGAVCTIEVTP